MGDYQTGLSIGIWRGLILIFSDHQTYRSTPLIEPKPKVRRDWPMGCYLRHMEGPGWHDVPKTISVQDAGKMKMLDNATSVWRCVLWALLHIFTILFLML